MITPPQALEGQFEARALLPSEVLEKMEETERRRKKMRGFGMVEMLVLN